MLCVLAALREPFIGNRRWGVKKSHAKPQSRQGKNVTLFKTRNPLQKNQFEPESLAAGAGVRRRGNVPEGGQHNHASALTIASRRDRSPLFFGRS
jgi:hypothetical protein